MLDIRNENGVVTISYAGKIDSGNAFTIENELFDSIKDMEINEVIFDAKKLTMISSAGLRVILKVKKQYPNSKVINASQEIYEIFEMTGFTEMMDIKKGYRQISVDGCEILGEGATGIVYRYNPEIIVKVYKVKDALKEIEKERQLARKAFISGVPTAIPFDIVQVGDLYGSVFELLDIETFTNLMLRNPDNIDHYLEVYAELLRNMHGKALTNVDGLPNAKEFTLDYIKDFKKYISDETYQKLESLIKNVPDTTNLIHGDCQTSNVVMQNNEVLLIDMEFLSYGHPVFELGPIVSSYICFNDIDHNNVKMFFGFEYETSTHIWKQTLKNYLQTNDEARLQEVENKCLLIGYCRVLRFFILCKDLAEQYSKDMVQHCIERITALTSMLDTLEF